MASPLPRTLDVARSLASTLAQQGRGIATRPAGRLPSRLCLGPNSRMRSRKCSGAKAPPSSAIETR